MAASLLRRRTARTGPCSNSFCRPPQPTSPLFRNRTDRARLHWSSHTHAREGDLPDILKDLLHNRPECLSSTHFSMPCKFAAIYADPPWSFRNWSANRTNSTPVTKHSGVELEFAIVPNVSFLSDKWIN